MYGFVLMSSSAVAVGTRGWLVQRPEGRVTREELLYLLVVILVGLVMMLWFLWDVATYCWRRRGLGSREPLLGLETGVGDLERGEKSVIVGETD
jgi:hypothetical protein